MANPRSSFLFRFTTVALGVGMIALCACSDDEDSGSKDPAATCKDVCTTAGFSSSRVDAQSNETNCFCTGGTGAVTAAACTQMCTSLGKGKAQVFKSTGQADDSCQCS